MEYHVKKTQAAATTENFTREMIRTSVRRQIRIPAPSAKMLKKTARTENQLINQKYLTSVGNEGRASFCRCTDNIAIQTRTNIQRNAASRGPAVINRVPG